MQFNQSLSKKSSWLLPLVIAIFSLLLLSSCKDKIVKGSCIALSKSQIKKAWVNPGHFKNIDYLVFITYYNPVNYEFKVMVQAYKKDYTTIGPMVKLLSGDSCPTKLGHVSISENLVDLKDLGISDMNGDLVDFAYITLSPYVDSSSYLRYNTNVVDKEFTSTIPKVLQTVPCPPCPTCKPPCPADCFPICTTKDSMDYHIPPYNFVDTTTGK